MNHLSAPAPVVVGVDWFGGCADALDWAAAEASVRGCELWLVHAWRSVPQSVFPLGQRADQQLQRDLCLLEGAVARARRVAPGLAVRPWRVSGSPAVGLRRLRAEAIIVGCRGRSRWHRVLAGSVSRGLCLNPPCPVVVIAALRAAEPGPVGSRVVVGIDTAGFGRLRCPVIEFGMAAAAQRGVGITLLHVCTPSPPPDVDAFGDDEVVAVSIAHRALDEVVWRCRARDPELDIQGAVVVGDPVEVLAARTTAASMVVVGPPGHAVAGMALGSVTHGLLRQSHGPVAVVPRSPRQSLVTRGQTLRGSESIE